MPEPIDWSLATWEGSRRQQHREFFALPFREKLAVIEQLGQTAAIFAERRRARGLEMRGPDEHRGSHAG